MSVTVPVIVALAFVYLTGAPQSVKPGGKSVNFSGHWITDPPKDNSGLEPFCLWECSIEHDDKLLVVRTPSRVVRYRLDGVPETTTSTSKSGQFSTSSTVTARWKGDTIVISRKVDQLPERSFVVSLEKGLMVVSGSVRQFGQTGQGTGAVRYRRKAPVRARQPVEKEPPGVAW
jgi:hypothetical protein